MILVDVNVLAVDLPVLSDKVKVLDGHIEAARSESNCCFAGDAEIPRGGHVNQSSPRPAHAFECGEQTALRVHNGDAMATSRRWRRRANNLRMISGVACSTPLQVVRIVNYVTRECDLAFLTGRIFETIILINV